MVSALRVGVGCSGDPNPKKAAEEAVKRALSKLEKKPKALLIYSTISFCKDEKTIQQILKSVQRLVGSNVPLIGGTVTAFICEYGCFSRGLAVIAFEGKDMQVFSKLVTDIRNNTRSKGTEAGKTFSVNFKKSKLEHKLVIDVTAGPSEPKILGDPFVQYLLGKVPFSVFLGIRDFVVDMSRTFGFAQAMEEDFLDSMARSLPEVYLVGGSAFDDNKALSNYQFFSNKVFSSAFVGLGLSLKNPVVITRNLPLIFSGINLQVQRGCRDFCIDKINGDYAVPAYLSAMDWPESYKKSHIKEIFQKTFYYPLSFKEGSRVYAFPAGMFVGKIIGQNRRLRSDQLEICYTSSKLLFDAVKEHFLSVKRKSVFHLFVGASNMPGFLGSKVYDLKEFVESFSEAPFVFVFGSGEHSKLPGEEPMFNNFSLSMLSILEDEKPKSKRSSKKRK